MRAALNRYADRLVYWYRRWRYRRPPNPRLDVNLRGLAPAWIIHLLASACLVALVVLPSVRTTVPWPVGVALAVLIGLAAIWKPGYGPAVAAIVLAGLFLLGSPAAPFDPLVFALAGLAYVGYRLSLVAALLAWRGRIQLTALVGWLDGLILISTVALGGLALGLNGRGPVWLTLPGALGLIGSAALLSAGVRRSAEPQSGRMSSG